MDLYTYERVTKDKSLVNRLTAMARGYVQAGLDALAYWAKDWDVAYDTYHCYSQLTQKDLDSLERGHPRRYILPLTSAQVSTMASYIAQVLFGGPSPHIVRARGPEDEIAAEFMNQLLRWNAEQQPTYALGYLWAVDTIVANRGVFYNSWQPLYRPKQVATEVVDPSGATDPYTGQPLTVVKYKVEYEVVGGYNRMDLVSPYDFVCDPAMPLWRLQDMRYCGHRTRISIAELMRRAKLDPEHPAYVIPEAVEELVHRAERGNLANIPGMETVGVTTRVATAGLVSRTEYERQRIGASPSGYIRADKYDKGNVDCWELWVKLVPADYDLGEDTEPVVYQILIGGGDVILAMNPSTYAHGMYPYSVAEARPSAHFQFGQGWVGVLRGIQTYVDWLKDRHQQALSRTVGNIFLLDPSAIDVEDFLNPEKEGLLLTLKPEAIGRRLEEVFKQIPVNDLTERFLDEARAFAQQAELVTGVNAAMLGGAQEGLSSATEFAGVQQMAAGRLMSVARILSVMGLVPQTRQFVSNFQQFLDTPQIVRFIPNRPDLPSELMQQQSVTITKDNIQGEFDFIPWDGTLPGTDSRKVAAIARLLEAAAAFPQVFQPAPGNLDPRELLKAAARAAGLNVDAFVYKDVTPAAPMSAAPPQQEPAINAKPIQFRGPPPMEPESQLNITEPQVGYTAPEEPRPLE